jgi:Zn-finger nucleic acid-binding protein
LQEAIVANKWDERKKAQEDEYFVKKERELLAKLRAKQEAENKEPAAKTSSMTCPKCGEPLKERSFQKISIDQCTGCNGIWLDAGELEQVAEKEEGSWLGKFWQKNG